MILAGDLRDVTYEGLVALCSADPPLREGVRLDFKRELPKQGISKQLAAFANTVGGVVLVGVDEVDSHAKLPIEGVEMVPGLRERIVMAALEGVYPPLYPEVEFVPVPNTQPQRCVAIVRIGESALAPHAVESRQKIYVRVDSVTKPHDPDALATVEQIERMLARRRKAEELKRELIEEAREVAVGVLPSFRKPSRSGDHLVDLEFIMVPSFPAVPLASAERVLNLASETDTQYFSPPLRSGEDFPFDAREFRPVNGGAMAFTKGDYVQQLYMQFHQTGMVYGACTIAVSGKGDPLVRLREGTTHLVRVELLNPLLAALLAKSANFIEKLGHHGLVDVQVTLDNVKRRALGQKHPHHAGIVQISDQSYNSRIHVPRQVELHRLRSQPFDVLDDLYGQLTWAFAVNGRDGLRDALRDVATLTFDAAFQATSSVRV